MVKKNYDHKNKCCNVSFILPATVKASTIYLVGDFNNWNRHSTPLKRQPDGSWRADLRLQPEREYQFRYFINGREWQNDWEADRYAVHPQGGENSVLLV